MSETTLSLSKEKNSIEPKTLYIVATPIGNLSDISERALKVLSSVDFIAAEDTRNSGKLLSCFGIRKPMISYFEHNKREHGNLIANRILAGESCALITDAGTPAISDPGEDIVKICAEYGIKTVSVPGACAAICALTVSGLSTERFCFEGFLSANRSERENHLETLKFETRTMIFHEAPHKLKRTLSDMAKYFDSERKISLCRELTKLNEEVIRTTLSEAIAYYEINEPRGEYVLVVEGGTSSHTENFWSKMTVDEHIEYYVNNGLKKMDAIKAVARDRGVSKNIIYKETIKD